jgi:zinc transporter
LLIPVLAGSGCTSASPAILTGFLLPSTLVTGFFGMNTKDLPFQNIDGGTWWAASLAVGVTALTFFLLRRICAF